MSKIPTTVRNTSNETKKALNKQFDAWRKSKNSSALFPKETDDSFYNHNLGGELAAVISNIAPKLHLEKEVKLVQSGDQTSAPQRSTEPYSLTSKKLKVSFTKYFIEKY
jgi:hypothetical protein